MRRLHGDRRRTADQFLPDTGDHARRRQRHDDRGPRHTRPPASDAGGVRKARRLSVRVRHAWPDLLRRGRPRRDQGGYPEPRHRGSERAGAIHKYRTARTHERQHLSLRGLLQHRRGDHRGCREEVMKSFTYERAKSAAEAAAGVARVSHTKFIAGGTNLLDLMKLEIEKPAHLVDVNRLALDKIEASSDGGLRLGALVRNTDLAADQRVKREYGVLSRALLAGPRASCATRRPLPATFCREPAAHISTPPTCR